MSPSRLMIALVVALLGLGDASASPGPGHLQFRSYGADDGLAALDVYIGLQDHDGFIWAASPSGLFRFDGVRFRRFNTEDGLPSSLITDMAVAPDGVLWGATSRGLFYQRGDRFIALGTDVLPSDGMHLLAFDRARRTWITTTRGPFIATADGPVTAVDGWPGGPAFGILVDRDGAVLIGRGARLLRRPADGQQFDDVGHEFGGQISHLIRDGRGRLWVRAGTHLWMQPRPDAAFEDRSDLGGAVVGPTNLRLALAASGALLVPTESGLVEIDGDAPRLLATDLPADARSIKSVWLDREGALWVTSLGLHHELGRGRWRTVTTADGLPANNVWAVTGLRDGRVAVGTDHGVALFDGNHVETITDRSAISLLEQPAGVLWIAGAGLERYDLRSGQVKLHPSFGPTIAGAPTSLVAGGDGTVWIGTDRGTLYRMPAEGGAIDEVPLPGAEGARVWDLAVDGHGLWVTTMRGLFLRDDTGWRHFTESDGLRDDGLTFVIVRKDGELCVSYLAPLGATCGRYRDGRLEGLHHFDESAGLNSPVPYSLAEDLQGRLWIGGARGVSVLGDDAIDHFTRRGGAPGDDCNAGASWMSPTGQLWLGTSTGLGVFDGGDYAPAAPPRVTLVSGHLGASALSVVDWRSRIGRAVPYRNGHLDVEFAAVSFLDPLQVEYQVKLIGFEDGWRPSPSHDARYHRLPAGSYQFAVRARYPGGTWGEPTTFRFVVEKPWWETWWLRIAVALAALASIVAGVRWWSHALVARNLELERTVQERTQELINANAKVVQGEKLAALGRLLAQLSHEINNPLNVVQNNLGPLEDYSRSMRAGLEACRELASDPRMRAAVDELWQRLDLGYVIEDSEPAFASTQQAIGRITRIHAELKTFLRGEPLERAAVDLGASVRTTVAMFARSMPAIELRCAVPPLPLVMVHQGRIEQTIINLLQNAADGMGQAGAIVIDAEVDATHIRIGVADHGPGIPAPIRARIFEPFFTTKAIGKGLGLGLAICREIIQAHQGTLELDEHYTAGARFVISLPVADAIAIAVAGNLRLAA